MLIATLIAAGSLNKDSIHAAATLLEDARLRLGGWGWLDEGDAADIEVDADAGQLGRIRALLEGALPKTDVIVQHAHGREKKLLVADMDSTMIGQECIDELADYAGMKDEIAAVTDAAMRGEIDFAQALHQRVATLNGLGVGCIERCREERIRANPGARTLVQTMRARGAGTLLVTGGFHDFADPTAAELGFTEVRANYLDSMHGHLTGRVTGAIVDAAAKCEALIDLRNELGLSPAAVLAVGDGANDAPMIAEAGLGVAFRGKPKLREVADARLDFNDLTALLWGQGIRRADWVG
ncbi:phosphoserine phosphatase SerB [Sphingomonas sp. BN140010]|uniref:Phosphoserine phosphatase n=1 Tax=Sphingomonas arvum TaxID=2992113 RepID=A0ABT3JE81_9SPHN|nr:phosphoserine phosphatase SerB [Sphingomonas sp. BN140010]MCW3797388.1 phosphoserine phosphatase SerB [Sphingomonas sp. BN140010]